MSVYITTPARTAKPAPAERVVTHVRGNSLRIVHTPTLQEALQIADLWKAGCFDAAPGRKVDFKGSWA